jgi:23S rRNA pseudouridine2605 synthase
MTDENRPDANEPEASEEELIDAVEADQIEDPIGDETDGEAETSTEAEIEAAEDEDEDDEDGLEGESEIEDAAGDDEDEPEFKPKVRPPAKLERLQKILAAAGVASRRKAEEMIEQGRVQVNGKVVTEPGTKADSARDHIRVDGKLLQGAERQRYFVLNKPRGFVTTVKDPEGRPTVMQFFDKMRERLYPVGRLDYMSEGLLLVTNDGELANKLTRASAGVEKTYLVKVAGIPSEAELDILRAGVAIEKGGPGSGRVRTSPARIRQVRQGDNPWYEVVLIEGRNRELRKMFEEVGHFVEKIRRVGYGPLILDQEPGNLRELDPQELELLRKAADGKLRTPKAKEIRRRNIIDSLPPEKPAFRARGPKPAAGPKDYQPKKSFGTDRPVRSGPGAGKSAPAKFGSGPARFGAARPAGSDAPRPAWKKDAPPAGRPPARFGSGSTAESRPSAGRSFGDRPAAGRTFGDKPAGRTFGPRPGGARSFGDKPTSGRSFPPKPAWQKPDAGERSAFKRPAGPRPEATRRPAPEPIDDESPRKAFKLHIEPVQDFGRTERPRPERPHTERPSSSRPPSGYAGSGKSGPSRSGSGRSDTGRSGPSRPAPGRSGPGGSGPGRPGLSRPGGSGSGSGSGRQGSGRTDAGRAGTGRASSGRPASARPFRSEGGLARPFTTSSGKPRPGGARPSSKPGREGGRSYSAGASAGRPSRPYTPRGEGGEGFRPRGEDSRPEGSRPERRPGTGWKPKPNFAGKPGSGKPTSGERSKPRPGGFSKSGSKGSGYKAKPGGSGYKGKPSGSGPKRPGARPGGKKPGGKRP